MNYDGIFNYHEQVVFDAIHQLIEQQQISISNDDAEDIACLALNKLPSRYVRHSVDTAFYLSDEEKLDIQIAATEAVAHAFKRVKSHPGATD